MVTLLPNKDKKGKISLQKREKTRNHNSTRFKKKITISLYDLCLSLYLLNSCFCFLSYFLLRNDNLLPINSLSLVKQNTFPFHVQAAALQTTMTTSVVGKLSLPSQMFPPSSSGANVNSNQKTNAIPEPTKVVLRGKLEEDGSKGVEYSTYSRFDGSFEFENIPKGVYLMDILCPRFYYSQFRVLVNEKSQPNDNEEEGNLKVGVVEFFYNGAQKIVREYPIDAIAHSPISYFEYLDPYASLRNAMFNPMLWMMLFGVAMSYYMPKMLENMDEDQRKQFEQQQASMASPEAMLSSLLGGNMPNQPNEQTSSSTNQESSTRTDSNQNRQGKRVAAHRRKK